MCWCGSSDQSCTNLTHNTFLSRSLSLSLLTLRGVTPPGVPRSGRPCSSSDLANTSHTAQVEQISRFHRLEEVDREISLSLPLEVPLPLPTHKMLLASLSPIAKISRLLIPGTYLQCHI